MNYKIDPKLDLVLEKTVDISPELIWNAWTTPESLKNWFCPRPWQTPECEIDLRPGGKFRTVMRGPEGQEFDNVGCYLEIVKNQKLVWTSALLPGFRPAPPPQHEHDLHMTAVLLLEPHGSGTKYTAIAIHRSEQDRMTHEKMGFKEGWGIVLNQLVEYVKSQKR